MYLIRWYNINRFISSCKGLVAMIDKALAELY